MTKLGFVRPQRKIPDFDVGREKGTFLEAKKYFTDPRTSVETT